MEYKISAFPFGRRAVYYISAIDFSGGAARAPDRDAPHIEPRARQQCQRIPAPARRRERNQRLVLDRQRVRTIAVPSQYPMLLVRIVFNTLDFAVCDFQRDMGIQRFVSLRCGDLKDVLFALRDVGQARLHHRLSAVSLWNRCPLES